MRRCGALLLRERLSPVFYDADTLNPEAQLQIMGWPAHGGVWVLR
jgi:hypothetical protein